MARHRACHWVAPPFLPLLACLSFSHGRRRSEPVSFFLSPLHSYGMSFYQ